LIFNLFVAVDLAIAFFALIVGSYTAYKAYKIDQNSKNKENDEKYEQEKDYHLVSTVGWLTLGTRILSVPLFFVTVISLIPSVPGAMCEFGVFQAGSPFSWIDFGLKLFTIFAFGGWLFIDYANKKLKGAPLMGWLSRMFVLLIPLLIVDAILDIVFFGSLEPLVVPCCMVVYPPGSASLLNIGCPFCYVTYDLPLLMLVIPLYAIALALIVWSLVFRKISAGFAAKEDTSRLLSRAFLVSIILALLATILLVIQVLIVS